MKDCLFPYFCASCGREGEWWCKTCRGNVTPFNSPLGRLPAEVVGGRPACPVGRGGLAVPLNKVTAFFSYSDNPPLEKLIREFKYDYVLDISELWKEVFSETRLVFPADAIFVPVPLHDKRHRARGFNQAAVLTEILSDIYYRPQIENNLRRIRATDQQAGMLREERLKNIAGAFEWAGDSKVPKHVVLVDDVFTTGATMEECAKVLRSNGAEYIEAVVLAHG